VHIQLILSFDEADIPAIAENFLKTLPTKFKEVEFLEGKGVPAFVHDIIRKPEV